jgi:hypothetical protein
MSPSADLSDQRRYLEEVIPLARREEQTLFGDSLPSGIILRSSGPEE